MARLTAKQRAALPESDFAGPNRSYPVEDAGHRAAAKSMVARYGSPALQKKVDAKADARSGKKAAPKKKTTRKTRRMRA